MFNVTPPPAWACAAVILAWLILLHAGAHGAVTGERDYPIPFPLWPDGAPLARGKGPADTPCLAKAFIPEGKGPFAAILVLTGGAYGRLVGHESEPVARWLKGLGLAAFVVRYRVAPYRHPAPLLDAQRAIRLVRARAREWRVDPKRVGVMGFSAGGHLAACVATMFDAGKTDGDRVDREGSRPDVLIAGYPVITFGDHRHNGSMVNLLGPDPSALLRRSLSVETRVTARTPPSFIWHTADDATVPVENSLLLAEALARHDVPFDLHVFPRGGHGAGLAGGPPRLRVWTDLCAGWLEEIGFLPNSRAGSRRTPQAERAAARMEGLGPLSVTRRAAPSGPPNIPTYRAAPSARRGQADPLGPFPLWPDGAPLARGKGTADTPCLTKAFIPEGKGPFAAVVVVPGGGYSVHGPQEGEPIARWLSGLGLAAFVVRYRIAPYRHPAPLLDAQRAIRLVRARAREWRVDPKRVGIMGFSAGGHLAGCAATMFDAGKTDGDRVDRENSRPDPLIAGYPVITFGDHRHHGSMVNLLGPDPSERLRETLSVETRVTPRTPPSFIWHTADDPAVPVENSLLLAGALARHDVAFELHVFPRGGHATGLAAGHPRLRLWTGLCARWLEEIGFLSDPPAAPR